MGFILSKLCPPRPPPTSSQSKILSKPDATHIPQPTSLHKPPSTSAQISTDETPLNSTTDPQLTPHRTKKPFNNLPSPPVSAFPHVNPPERLHPASDSMSASSPHIVSAQNSSDNSPTATQPGATTATPLPAQLTCREEPDGTAVVSQTAHNSTSHGTDTLAPHPTVAAQPTSVPPACKHSDNPIEHSHHDQTARSNEPDDNLNLAQSHIPSDTTYILKTPTLPDKHVLHSAISSKHNIAPHPKPASRCTLTPSQFPTSVQQADDNIIVNSKLPNTHIVNTRTPSPSPPLVSNPQTAPILPPTQHLLQENHAAAVIECKSALPNHPAPLAEAEPPSTSDLPTAKADIGHAANKVSLRLSVEDGAVQQQTSADDNPPMSVSIAPVSVPSISTTINPLVPAQHVREDGLDGNLQDATTAQPATLISRDDACHSGDENSSAKAIPMGRSASEPHVARTTATNQPTTNDGHGIVCTDSSMLTACANPPSSANPSVALLKQYAGRYEPDVRKPHVALSKPDHAKVPSSAPFLSQEAITNDPASSDFNPLKSQTINPFPSHNSSNSDTEASTESSTSKHSPPPFVFGSTAMSSSKQNSSPTQRSLPRTPLQSESPAHLASSSPSSTKITTKTVFTGRYGPFVDKNTSTKSSPSIPSTLIFKSPASPPVKQTSLPSQSSLQNTPVQRDLYDKTSRPARWTSSSSSPKAASPVVHSDGPFLDMAVATEISTGSNSPLPFVFGSTTSPSSKESPLSTQRSLPGTPLTKFTLESSTRSPTRLKSPSRAVRESLNFGPLSNAQLSTSISTNPSNSSPHTPNAGCRRQHRRIIHGQRTLSPIDRKEYVANSPRSLGLGAPAVKVETVKLFPKSPFPSPQTALLQNAARPSNRSTDLGKASPSAVGRDTGYAGFQRKIRRGRRTLSPASRKMFEGGVPRPDEDGFATEESKSEKLSS